MPPGSAAAAARGFRRANSKRRLTRSRSRSLSRAHSSDALGTLPKGRAAVVAFRGGEIDDRTWMKLRIREALEPPVYDVADMYRETGLWQKIARHPVFENTTLAIILVNAVYIAVDTDRNHAPTLLQAHPFFQAAEHLFCVFFSFELFTRFMAFLDKRNCMRDTWFVFDSALVAMMVLETWVMTAVLLASSGGGSSPLGKASILRLFRLLRLTRITRLMRMIPELMVLVRGMVAGMRSVLTVMCLLMVVMYVFAIAFTQLARDSSMGTKHFDTVGESLYTLLVHGVFLDSLEYICTILEQDTLCLLLFFVFVMLSSLTVMNMLIGVLCEVVSAVAEVEKDGLQVNSVTDKLQVVISELDADSNGLISKSEFMQILAHPGVAEALNEVNVDPVGIVDFADYIFDDASNKSDEISFDDFMKLVLSLRGSNHVSVKDIVDLRKHVLNALEKLEAEVLAAQAAQRASDAVRGLQPRAWSAGRHGGASQWRVEEVRKLEEKVGRAEGLLVALCSEVRRLSARLELRPQMYGQQPRPPTAQAAASRRCSRSSGPQAQAPSRTPRKRSVDTLLSNVPAPRRSSILMGEREDGVHESLQLPHSLF
mmetsp:Transcript_79417/g.247214  ORF Transcript_79417/g.247214 Transcript_79417/m.247214 type:complete len:597 (-) Transcript_79417:56-1846(-)